MPKTANATDCGDAVKAVAFITGMNAADITGYVVIALLPDDDMKISANATTKAGCVSILSEATARMAYELAADLDGILTG